MHEPVQWDVRRWHHAVMSSHYLLHEDASVNACTRQWHVRPTLYVRTSHTCHCERAGGRHALTAIRHACLIHNFYPPPQVEPRIRGVHALHVSNHTNARWQHSASTQIDGICLHRPPHPAFWRPARAVLAFVLRARRSTIGVCEDLHLPQAWSASLPNWCVYL